MKVLRIIARLNVGGPARHVVWLTAGLRAAGCETVLVAGVVPPGEDDMGYFASANGVEPLIIPQMSREISPRDALTVWKLYRLFVRERPELVHTHTAKAGTVGRVAGMLYRWLTPGALVGRPRRCLFVHTYHGHIFHSYYGPLKTRLFLMIERLLARVATDRIVVISPQQYREIHEEFGVGRSAQFAVIPLGLELDQFNDWPGRRSRLRRELGAAERDVLVGIVGRLTEIKNHSLFLQVAARYKAAHDAGQELAHRARASEGGTAPREPRVRFVVIGDGHLRARLEDEARALGVEGDVSFLGTRDDPENFYPALDVVALTSLNEGTPLTLIEAMANERATIATAVGGVVDLFGEELGAGAYKESSPGAAVAVWPQGVRLCERGVLVRPGDAEGFCAGLARLVEDEGLRREMGERGRRFVAEHYSKQRLLKDVAGLYQEMKQAAMKSGAKSGVWNPEQAIKGAKSKLPEQGLDL